MRIQLFLGLLLTTQITSPAALLARLKRKQASATPMHRMPIRRYSDLKLDFPTGWAFTAGAIGGGILTSLGADAWWLTLTPQEKEAAAEKKSLVTFPIPYPGVLIGGATGLAAGFIANHGIKGALIRLTATSVGLATVHGLWVLHEKREREVSILKKSCREYNS